MNQNNNNNNQPIRRNRNLRRRNPIIRNRMRGRRFKPLRGRRNNNNIRRITNNINNNNRRRNIIDRNQNIRINQLENRMKNLSLVPNINLNKYFNKIKFYIDALLNPDKYINSGIKIPNPLTTYSYCYGFKEQFNVSIGSSGSFTLIWWPNFFSCNNYRVSSELSYGGPTIKIQLATSAFVAPRRFAYNMNDHAFPNYWFLPSTHIMATPMEGYRLVSASIIIRYVGEVLSQSGYILSAPTYREIPCFTSFANENSATVVDYNGFPKYDDTIINNTRGSASKFIVNDNFVKRIYVPLDSFDCNFEDPGYYYSITSSKQGPLEFQSWDDAYADGRIIKSEDDVNLRILKQEEGNPIKFVFLGKGFKMNISDCINVTAYYNFECIPVEGTVIPNNNNSNFNNEFDLSTNIKEEIFNKMKEKVLVEPEKVNKRRLINEIVSNIKK